MVMVRERGCLQSSCNGAITKVFHEDGEDNVNRCYSTVFSFKGEVYGAVLHVAVNKNLIALSTW